MHDTIARVIAHLNPKKLQQCFADWMRDVTKRTEGELIAIDGKTLRGSWQPGDRGSAIHMVSAFACHSAFYGIFARRRFRSRILKLFHKLCFGRYRQGD